MILTTRTTLKRLEKADAHQMYAYASDEETTHYMDWPRHKSLDDTYRVIEHIGGLIAEGKNDGYAIHLNGHGMIGTIGMMWKEQDRVEIGYIINKLHWGKGIVTEVGNAFLAYIQETYPQIKLIEARCHTGNEASAIVMQKLGMEYKGFLPDEVFQNIDPEKKFPVRQYCLLL